MQPDEVNRQLERILASAAFRRSAVQSRLLRFIVARTLEGDTASLKESGLAVGVFSRDVTDLARDDSIVRVHARKLRQKLDHYYSDAGAADPIRIRIPKGAYVAVVEQVDPPRSTREPGPPPGFLPFAAAGALAAMTVLAVAGMLHAPMPATAPASGDALSDAERASRLEARGRQLWGQGTQASLERSVELYRQALRFEPRSARLWASIADSYHLMGALGQIPRDRALELGAAALARARAIDPDSPEALAAAGFARMRLDPARPDPEPLFRAALRQDPHLARAHQWYSTALSVRGAHADAIRHAQRAVTLEPSSAIHYAGLGRVYFFARQHARSIESLETALELRPDFHSAAQRLAYSYLELGRAHDAASVLEQSIERSGRRRGLLVALARARSRLGQHDQAREIRREIASAVETASFGLAVLDLDQGRLESGFRQLHRIAASGRFPRVGLATNPLMDPFRQDPRFHRLIARVHGESGPRSRF